MLSCVEWYMMKRKISHVSVQNLKLYVLDRYIGGWSGPNTWTHTTRKFLVWGSSFGAVRLEDHLAKTCLVVLQITRYVAVQYVPSSSTYQDMFKKSIGIFVTFFSLWKARIQMWGRHEAKNDLFFSFSKEKMWNHVGFPIITAVAAAQDACIHAIAIKRIFWDSLQSLLAIWLKQITFWRSCLVSEAVTKIEKSIFPCLPWSFFDITTFVFMKFLICFNMSACNCRLTFTYMHCKVINKYISIYSHMHWILCLLICHAAGQTLRSFPIKNFCIFSALRKACAIHYFRSICIFSDAKQYVPLFAGNGCSTQTLTIDIASSFALYKNLKVFQPVPRAFLDNICLRKYCYLKLSQKNALSIRRSANNLDHSRISQTFKRMSKDKVSLG